MEFQAGVRLSHDPPGVPWPNQVCCPNCGILCLPGNLEKGRADVRPSRK